MSTHSRTPIRPHRSGGAPAAASGLTDSESGNEGESTDKALYALEAMYKRGLIPEAVYQERLTELKSGK
jgi:hypothetical protein